MSLSLAGRSCGSRSGGYTNLWRPQNRSRKCRALSRRCVVARAPCTRQRVVWRPLSAKRVAWHRVAPAAAGCLPSPSMHQCLGLDGGLLEGVTVNLLQDPPQEIGNFLTERERERARFATTQRLDMICHISRSDIFPPIYRAYGIRVGTQRLAILAFADDMSRFARSKAQVQTMLTQLSSFLRSNGLAAARQVRMDDDARRRG